MRLIVDPPAPAWRNMALDEALLEAAGEGSVPPTLRFYTFWPPALTLGYSQRVSDQELTAYRKAGVDVVRRPTGGRAVLHDGDLTYAVVQPVVTGESVKSSYCRISSAIAAAIRCLGGPAAVAPAAGKSVASTRSADCFALFSAADLVAGDRKIVGSAQVRRRGFLLQHGSIRLADAGIAGLSDRLSQAIATELKVAWHLGSWTASELELARTIAARSAFAPCPPGSRQVAPQAAG